MFFNHKRLLAWLGVLMGAILLTWGLFSTRHVFSSNALQESEGEPSNSTITILKPGEPEGFVPTPVPDIPLAVDVPALTPGQPLLIKERPSQDELEKLAQPPWPSPDVPYNGYLSVDSMVDSMYAAFNSSTIVIAKVSVIHPSQWTTPDGKRPQNPYDLDHPNSIYTLIDVQVQEVLKGEVGLGEIITLFKSGGQIGEDTFIDDNRRHEYAEGQLLLLYLDHFESDNVPSNAWRVVEKFVIDSSTNIASATFTDQKSLDELRSEISEAKDSK